MKSPYNHPYFRSWSEKHLLMSTMDSTWQVPRPPPKPPGSDFLKDKKFEGLNRVCLHPAVVQDFSQHPSTSISFSMSIYRCVRPSWSELSKHSKSWCTRNGAGWVVGVLRKHGETCWWIDEFICKPNLKTQHLCSSIVCFKDITLAFWYMFSLIYKQKEMILICCVDQKLSGVLHGSSILFEGSCRMTFVISSQAVAGASWN